ncbi:MAG: hypothetical protein H0W48_00270 [Methylibium sp.]|nr:hypothetical protein [Methylibium sp.]
MNAVLSPLTRYRLHERQILDAIDRATPPAVKRNRPIEVLRYQCPVCDDEHDYESEAEQCCPYEASEGEEAIKDGVLCPVCRSLERGYFDAADCCLWKDIEPAGRYRIARAVEAGAEWIDAIADVTGVHE